MGLFEDIDGFLNADELAEEEKELKCMFEEDNFFPADKDFLEPNFEPDEI